MSHSGGTTPNAGRTILASPSTASVTDLPSALTAGIATLVALTSPKPRSHPSSPSRTPPSWPRSNSSIEVARSAGLLLLVGRASEPKADGHKGAGDRLETGGLDREDLRLVGPLLRHGDGGRRGVAVGGGL